MKSSIIETKKILAKEGFWQAVNANMEIVFPG
jgi:hypothetical protein